MMTLKLPVQAPSSTAAKHLSHKTQLYSCGNESHRSSLAEFLNSKNSNIICLAPHKIQTDAENAVKL